MSQNRRFPYAREVSHRNLVFVGVLAMAAVLAGVGPACSSFGSDGGPGDGAGAGGGGGDGGVAVDGAGSADGAPGSADPGVFCSGAYCKPPAQVCCAALAGGGAGCVAAGDEVQCPPPGLTFACDDGADCPADRVCCGSLGSTELELFGTQCLPLFDCKKQPEWVVVCDPNAIAPCPAGVGCTTPDGGGYGFCDGLRRP